MYREARETFPKIILPQMKWSLECMSYFFHMTTLTRGHDKGMGVPEVKRLAVFCHDFQERKCTGQ